MKTYYYADKLDDSNKISPIKSQRPIDKQCVESVNINSDLIAKKLGLPANNELLIYKSDIFYYVFTVKYTNGHYMIVNEEVLSSSCPLYFCI
ncbi:MAG: hypothetical protein M0D57_12105 [Sphingobacteriales bacterium JAD_PAG50586_3]|nr:MAG: hypothetical protein M0D57_12105 [Sphingobacteriales bacterium JAD_PAG50586_3]